jgi:hypothetical protein
MNDLLQFILEMRSGRVAMDCNAKFNEMIQAVLETGGKGELTIKIKAVPATKGRGGCVLSVLAEHECKIKKPELEIGSSTFFATPEGLLTREDPAQAQMFDAEDPAEVKGAKN